MAKGKILLFTLSFLFFPFYFALAQIPTCANAIKAAPPGPFPCSVTATWVDNSGNDPKVNDQETGFILQRRLNGGAWAAIGGVLAPNTTSAIDATLQQALTGDNLYEYRVAATNSMGTSAWSNLASFTIPMGGVAPKPPSTLTITFNQATGELACPTCAGGDKKVPLNNDDGTLVITSSAQITIDYK